MKSNSRKAINNHVDDEDKGVTKCDTLRGKQDLTIINKFRLLLFLSKSLFIALLYQERNLSWIKKDI